MQSPFQQQMTRPNSRCSVRLKRMQRPTATGRNRLGAALVEFAVVSPLMILFTLGMIEIGRMTMVKQLLVNVSREGAREGTLSGSTNESVQASVQSLLARSYINGATVTVTSGSIPASTGNYVSVAISVPSESVSWLSTPLFMGGRTVTASTSMRKESL